MRRFTFVVVVVVVLVLVVVVVVTYYNLAQGQSFLQAFLYLVLLLRWFHLHLVKPVFQLFLSLLRSRFSAILDDIGVSQAPWRALSTIVCFLHESVCLLLLFGCLCLFSSFVCLLLIVSSCLYFSVFSFVPSFAVCLSFLLSDCLSVSALPCDCLFACLSFRRLSRLTN